MDITKRKALHAAIAAGLAAGPGVACAVYEDPHGLGQALIYPYYTVQSAGGNAFNTYLSVTNTTTRAKAVKVRFREGRNARAVLDFNLYLSPNDVWTAALGPADATATSPAILVTADSSCTSPPIPQGGMPFNNFRYSGVDADGGPTTLDRTREGYFEIIEMANLLGGAATAAVTHTAAGIPANCAFVQATNGFTAASSGASFAKPSGGLAGTYTVINVANGLNFGGNATALAQFSSSAIFTDIGADGPDLSSATPARAIIVAGNGADDSAASAATYIANYANGRDAVSATLMRASLVNEYVLDTATKSATDWVVTFPTRQFYVGASGAQVPFSNSLDGSAACEEGSFNIFDRETNGRSQVTITPPLPPGPAVGALCWASTVISWADTGTRPASLVFGSRNVLSISPFQPNGLVRMAFTGPGATAGLSSSAGTGTVINAKTGAIATTAATVNLRGLPAIGFMARTLNNGTLSCTTFGGSPGVCAGSYGAAFDHKYAVSATPLP